jgi:AcrR family transcriptional regulator
MEASEVSATGKKIAEAAEFLFAEWGYHGVSLRQITARAGVNLAAVNYHHSDKESLYSEILRQRLREMAQARLVRLVAAETAAAGAPVPLGELIDLLAEPLLAPATGGAPARRLIGRSLVEPLPFTAPIIAAELQPGLTRCGQAVRRHLPGLPPADFIWTFSFVVGALHHAAASLHDMKARTSGFCGNDDVAGALANFREFALTALGPNRFR